MSFKVGDWVQHKYLNTIFWSIPASSSITSTPISRHLDCITSLKLEPRIKWDLCLFQGKYNSDDCVLWQPKEGEWCWFWNKDSEMPPVLRRFKQTQKDGAHITKDDCYFYDYCETFIGELPSFLKDK